MGETTRIGKNDSIVKNDGNNKNDKKIKIIWEFKKWNRNITEISYK